jgi:hypothetical protein
LKEVGQQYPGDLWAPEWQHNSDHTKDKRTLFAVACKLCCEWLILCDGDFPDRLELALNDLA